MTSLGGLFGAPRGGNWMPSNMAAGIFPVPSLTPMRSGRPAPSVDGLADAASTLSSPRMPRSEGPTCGVLPPPSRASTASSSGHRTPRGAEDYLKQMQLVGHAHQEQLQILEKHWDLMQDFEQGKLKSFKQEHAVLKQKQLHLLQEVESQLQELRLGPSGKLQEVTFAQSPPRRVLVLGADLLLGRQVIEHIRGKWQVRGVSSAQMSDPTGGFPELDFQLERFQPQVVLHLSGTETSLKDGPNALSLAAFAANTRAIVAACEAHGVWLLHLSSDAVFNGLAAPYTVNAEPNPVTQDGVVTLEAEQQVLRHPRSVVLRVPRCLYGPVQDLEESPVTGVLDRLRKGQMDFDVQPLYPTFTGDVAQLLLRLLEHLLSGGTLRGIYHWQGPDQLSELQMAKVWCEAAGTPATFLRARGSKLLADRALDTSRIARSFPVLATSFKEGIKECLPPGQFGGPGTALAGTLHWASGCRAVGEQVV